MTHTHRRACRLLLYLLASHFEKQIKLTLSKGINLRHAFTELCRKHPSNSPVVPQTCAVNIRLTVQSIRPFGIRLMKCLQTLCFVAVTWPFQNRQAWTGEYCSAVWLFWCTEQWKKKNVGPKRIWWWSLNGSPPTTSFIFCLSGNIKYYKSLCLPDFHYIPITFWTISVTNQYPTLQYV